MKTGGRVGRRRGAVAVVVGLCLIPLIGIMAFAFDGGLMLATKRRSQTVADASAHAAAVRLYANIVSDVTGLDVSGNARGTALSLASTNGYNNDGKTNTVTVNIPPQSGLFENKPGYAEVIITTVQARIFGAVLGSGSMTFAARAVARGIKPTPTPYTTASLILLDPSASGALTVTGGVNLNAESTVQVDSSSVSAGKFSGGVNVNAPTIQITGNYTKDNSTNFGKGTPQTAAPSIPDPLASLVAPAASSLTARSFTSTYGTATLNPGVYSGGLTIANGMNVTLNPGIYYMKGGSFNVAGGVNVAGSGVTIYVDNGGGTLNVQGGANLTLTPPTSGTYAGLTYFQDRTSTASMNIANGANVNMAGTIYAAKSSLSLAGGSNNKYGSQLVVDSLSLSNGINLSMTTLTDQKSGYIASNSSSTANAVALVQ